jgi:hypothetical protein
MQILYAFTGGSVVVMTIVRSVSLLRKKAAPPPPERPARKPAPTPPA